MAGQGVKEDFLFQVILGMQEVGLRRIKWNLTWSILVLVKAISSELLVRKNPTALSWYLSCKTVWNASLKISLASFSYPSSLDLARLYVYWQDKQKCKQRSRKQALGLSSAFFALKVWLRIQGKTNELSANFDLTKYVQRSLCILYQIVLFRNTAVSFKS